MTSYTHTHNAGIDSYQFDNGFKLIMAHYPGAPNAHVELVVKVGSKNEGYGETGMAHLLEHMLFKSTPLTDDIKSTLTSMASDWNGTTSVDRTNYYEVVSPEKVLSALELELNRLLNATFTQEHLRTEMTVVRNEMDRGASSDSNVMIQTMLRSGFDWHGYGRSTIGSPSDVEDAPFAALRAFYKKHYRVSNAFLLVTGNFDPAAVFAYVKDHFGSVEGSLDQNIVTANWTIEDAHRGATERDVFMPGNKVQTWLGWRMPPMFSREAVALQLAMDTLGSKERGTLRKELVINEKKLVNVQGSPYDLIDGGMYLVLGHGQETDSPRALGAILAERVYHHVANEFSESDLEEARQEELSNYHEVLTNWENLSYVLVDAELQGDWQWAFVRKTMVESVTYDEMVAAARKWIVSHGQTSVYLHHGTPVCPSLFKVPNPSEFPVFESIIQDADAVASSYEELHGQDIVWNADAGLRVSLSQRNTQAGYVYIEYDNVVGNDETRAPHFHAAQCVRELRAFGGAGRDQKVLSAWLSANKADLDFRTSGFSLRVTPENVLDVLKTALDLLHTPQFSLDEFNAFKDKKLTGLKAAMAKHEAVLSTRLAQQWSNFPANHWGRSDSLEEVYNNLLGVQYEDAKAVLAWLSKRGAARLSIVGDVDRDEVNAMLNAYIAAYPHDEQNEHVPFMSPDYGTNLTAEAPILVELGNAPNALVIAKGPLLLTKAHSDVPALTLAIQAFGGDAVSRLWMRIREQGGMAYQVGANMNWNALSQRSSLSMMSSCSVEQMHDVHAAMSEEWANFVKDGITQEELTHSKEQRALHHQSKIQNDESYVEVYHRAALTQQDYQWHAQLQQSEQDATLEEVNAAIQKHFSALPVQWALARNVAQPEAKVA